MSKEAMKLALEAINNLITSSHATDPQHWRDARQDAVTALAAIDKALAEQPAQQEPVAAECNFVGTKEWGRCSIEHHNFVQSEPHKWPGYQTRLLYTSPQPAQQEPVPDWDAWNACSRLNSALEAIGDFAHDKSTGPAEPDALWEIRTMAYDAIEATAPQPAPVQQEPVAWMTQARNFVHLMEFTEAEAKLYGWKAVYTTPQPAQRKPLTDEQIKGIYEDCDAPTGGQFTLAFARAIEASHGIKENT